MSSKITLIESLDLAAAHLLARAQSCDKVTEDGKIEKVTLAEQVKAFEAVVDYAKTRKELAPPEKKESQFDKLKRDFSGSPPKRGRNRPKASQDAGDDSDSGSDFPTVYSA